MFINATGYFIPEGRVSNDHFFEINGLTSEWILQRTGIQTRSKAENGENDRRILWQRKTHEIPAARS